MISFQTRDEMISAGYVPARTGTVARMDGGEVRVIDTGLARGEFGYDYAIRAFVRHDWIRGGQVIQQTMAPVGDYGQSESVWVDQARNKGGSTGAVYAAFAPEVYRQGLEQAKAALTGANMTILPDDEAASELS